MCRLRLVVLVLSASFGLALAACAAVLGIEEVAYTVATDASCETCNEAAAAADGASDASIDRAPENYTIEVWPIPSPSAPVCSTGGPLATRGLSVQ